MTPETLQKILPIATELLKRNWLMGTAESCTGGMVATALTAVPGSSAWFAGALVTYAVPWKERLLGVPHEIIENQGVVSEPTVLAMLQGLRTRLGLDAGVAVSGIAGPGGAEPGKPVGTVVIGVFAGDCRKCETCHFSGDREAVRCAATEHALLMLERTLREIP